MMVTVVKRVGATTVKYNRV